ncbi:MAG: hypothetical protein ACYSTY_09145, partial [Planctomycetota bacterium]
APRSANKLARRPADKRASRSTKKLDPLARAREQDRLLRIIEDPSLLTATRHGALRELETHATPACVPRLVGLLPGEWDLITYRVLVILEEIGDPAALPRLEAMRASMSRVTQNRQHRIPNSVVKALNRAIEACGGKRVATGDERSGGR